MQESGEMINVECSIAVSGSRMYQVHLKLKKCKIRFIKWRKGRKSNARVEIDLIQQEMERLHEMGGVG